VESANGAHVPTEAGLGLWQRVHYLDGCAPAASLAQCIASGGLILRSSEFFAADKSTIATLVTPDLDAVPLPSLRLMQTF
jgi:hypothetical protein